MDDLELNQVILEKNNKAPYTGILVPEYMYRSMHQDIYKVELYESELQKCLEDKAKFLAEPSKSTWFLGGVFTTVVVFMLVSK